MPRGVTRGIRAKFFAFTIYILIQVRPVISGARHPPGLLKVLSFAVNTVQPQSKNKLDELGFLDVVLIFLYIFIGFYLA